MSDLSAESLLKRINAIANRIKEIGGEVEMEYEGPASDAQMRELPIGTPPLIVELIKNHHSGFFGWNLEGKNDDFPCLSTLGNGGRVYWNASVYEVDRNDYWWADEDEAEDNGIDWRPALSVLTALNGDMILSVIENGEVMLFSHDDPDSYNNIIAKDFASFMDLWSRLGFPWFELPDFCDFINQETGLLDPALEKFKKVAAELRI